MNATGKNAAPMSFAEAAECCGQLDVEDARFQNACANCPLLIERRRDDVLRTARAQ